MDAVTVAPRSHMVASPSAEETSASPALLVPSALPKKLTLSSALNLRVHEMAKHPDLMSVTAALEQAMDDKHQQRFLQHGETAFSRAIKSLTEHLEGADAKSLASAFVGTQIETLSRHLTPEGIEGVVREMYQRVSENPKPAKNSLAAKENIKKLHDETRTTIAEFYGKDRVSLGATKLFDLFDAAEPLADIVVPNGDWGKIGGAKDLLGVVSVVSSFRQVMQSRGLARLGGALLIRSQQLMDADSITDAEIAAARGNKLIQVAAGMAITGAVDIGSSLLSTVGGASMLGDAAQSTLGAVAGNASSVVGAVLGLIEIGMSTRNFHNAYAHKRNLRELQDHVIIDYAKVPGTADEVDLMYDLVKAKKHKLNMKMISGSFGIARGTVATASAVTAAVTALAATSGVGTIALAAVGAGVSLGQMVTKKVVQGRWDSYQKALRVLGEAQRTPAHTYAALYVQIKSEQEMLKRREEARLKMGDLEYQFRTTAVGILPDGLTAPATPQEPIFTNRVCPLIFGISGEAFVATVELTLDYLREQIMVERPQIVEDLATREAGGGDEAELADVELEGVDIELVLKYQAETDPVWKTRLLQQIQTGAVGVHYRPGGRKEFKKFTECDERIIRTAGKIKELKEKLGKLEAQKSIPKARWRRQITEAKLKRTSRKYAEIKIELSEGIEENEQEISRLEKALKKCPDELKDSLQEQILALRQENRGYRRLLRQHGALSN